MTTTRQMHFAPHPALCDVVNNIIIGDVVTNDLQVNLSFPFPPLPEHSIIFYPYDKPSIENAVTGRVHTLWACTIVGPQAERSILSLGNDHLMIKIGFQPGALYRLLGEPMYRMLQKDCDGEAVFGSEVKNITDALANAVDFTAMKNITDKFMFSRLAKIKKPIAVDYVIPEIIKSGGMIKIDKLIKSAYMSNRQFERTFKDRMGVSPKYFSRLVRFGKAWLLKETNPHLTWTEVAYKCDYFDQMHLIRDFKEFANANPKEISNALQKQPFLLGHKIYY